MIENCFEHGNKILKSWLKYDWPLFHSLFYILASILKVINLFYFLVIFGKTVVARRAFQGNTEV